MLTHVQYSVISSLQSSTQCYLQKRMFNSVISGYVCEIQCCLLRMLNILSQCIHIKYSVISGYAREYSFLFKFSFSMQFYILVCIFKHFSHACTSDKVLFVNMNSKYKAHLNLQSNIWVFVLVIFPPVFHQRILYRRISFFPSSCMTHKVEEH